MQSHNERHDVLLPLRVGYIGRFRRFPDQGSDDELRQDPNVRRGRGGF